MRWRIPILPFALVAACAAPAHAAQCRAVIVTGDPGDDAVWAANFARWGEAWQALLSERGVAEADLRVLRTPPKPQREAAGDALATRAHVVTALEALARGCAPEDQAVVVLIGHGYQCEGVGKLCLPGPDLADADVARALAPLRAHRTALLVLAPDAAPWAGALARPGRVVVCANVKQSAPYFGEFLLRALRGGSPLLDAFNQASLATIAWYQNQFQLPGEAQPTVHGRENQDVFRLVYGTGFVAGDAEPRAAVNDIARNAAFRGRRVLVEVAGLDDDGDGKPATVYHDGIEPKPLDGATGGDGAVARDLVLGRP